MRLYRHPEDAEKYGNLPRQRYPRSFESVWECVRNVARRGGMGHLFRGRLTLDENYGFWASLGFW